MNKALINELIEKNELKFVEQNLLYSYLQKKNLDFEKSPILSKELSGFEPDTTIQLSISSLSIDTIKDLEQNLELLIPKSDRKVNGAFFTPTYIVDFIVDELKPKPDDKCLDPSCGCGAFLVGLVQYFHEKYQKPVKQIIKDNIFGADILEYNVRRAKNILAIFALSHSEIISDEDFNIYNHDSLKAKWQQKFQVIAGNPPYVKYQDLSDENRSYLIQNWSTIENGTFNLYFAFFELGYKLLSSDGRLGYITPNNYFTSLAGLSLRAFFQNKKCLSRIVDFSHRKVFDAQTYTAISFIDKEKNSSILFDKVKDSQSCQEFLKHANGSPNAIKNLSVKKWRLLKTDEQENIRIIESIGTPIKKLFNIAVGIATLKDEVFFIDSKVEENGKLIKTTENGTFFIEKEITKPVYKISQFKTQSEILNNTLRIITPYKFTNGSAQPYSEDELRSKFPLCYEYLLSEKQTLKGRDKGKSEYNPFYVWGRTQGITRFGRKILNPTFSKVPRFLFVPEEDAYYTNGYGIYFTKNSQAGLFDDMAHPLSKEENILIVQKILNSIVMHYYVTKTSVSIQGGYPCYQKNFIEKFTIPNFTSEELKYLEIENDKHEIDKFLVEKYQLSIELPNLVS